MRFAQISSIVLVVSTVAAPVAAQPAYQHLRIIAPAAPGGGWDQTARVMQQVLQRAGIVHTSSVENIPGAAGTIGLARFIGAERGNGDVVMVSGLIMLGAIVTHASPVTLREVTPIARLTGEYEVIVVPTASPFRSLDDLVRAFRERPESISWGGGSAGGTDQMLAGARGRCRRRVSAARELHRLLRRGRIDVCDSRRTGVGGHQRPGGVRSADRGGHRARAGHLERRAVARRRRHRRSASRVSTSSSRTGARLLRLPASALSSGSVSREPSRPWCGRPNGARRSSVIAGSIAIWPATSSPDSLKPKTSACARS